MVVGSSLLRWRRGSNEKGQKQVGGICRPRPPAAGCCPLHTLSATKKGPKPPDGGERPGDVRPLLWRRRGGVGGP